jgi:hypothetical protein
MTNANSAFVSKETDNIVAAENESIICGYCVKNASPEDNFCLYCGYPIKGSDQEQKNFLANIASSKIDLAEAENNIKSARNYIYALAAFTLVSSLVMLFAQDDVTSFVINAILALIYGGIGYWANSKSFAAILTAMILYFTIILLNAFVDPTTLFTGIIFKVIITGLLIKGLRSSMEWEKISKRITPDE